LYNTCLILCKAPLTHDAPSVLMFGNSCEVRSVVKKIVCNDRIIALKLKAAPISILIMQVYMRTSEYEDDEVETFYDTIEEILEEHGNGDTNNIIRGDWKRVVGDESYRNIVGSHGLGRRNHRGQMLIDFCD